MTYVDQFPFLTDGCSWRSRFCGPFFFSLSLCCSFPVYVTAMRSHIDYASLGASDGLAWDCYYPTIQRRFTKEGATEANLSLYSSSSTA